MRGLYGLSVVYVPLDDSEDEAVAFEIGNLPKAEEAIYVLTEEKASIEIWHRVALLYYRSGNSKEFLEIAETGYKVVGLCQGGKSGKATSNNLSSFIGIVLSIGACYARLGYLATDQKSAELYVGKAKKAYEIVATMGPSNSPYERDFYAGLGYLQMMASASDMQKAEKHFMLIDCSETNQFIPGILGKGFVAFHRKNYSEALKLFRQVLRLSPFGSANVRVGIGHCLWKLNFKEQAKMAYERAVEIYPNDSNALCALAIFNMNTCQRQAIYDGLRFLKRAYCSSTTHPITLTLLADHYYHRKEYDKAMKLAFEAQNQIYRGDEVSRRIAFVLGRTYEAKDELNQALHYYYVALQEPHYKGFHLPFYAIARIYLFLNDLPRCSDILLKLLKVEPKNIFAKKMFGCVFCNCTDYEKRKLSGEYLEFVLAKKPDDVMARIALATAQESIDDVKAAENYKAVLQYYDKIGDLMPHPEVHNNLGCTLFRLKKHEKATSSFETALKLINDIKEVCGREADLRPLTIGVKYNLARNKEASFEIEEADHIYKNILTEHPSYYCCSVRRAIIAREKGNIYDATVYFKQGLEFSLKHPDVWTLMGLLHLSQGELNLAAKKFLKISDLKNGTLKTDSYNMIALGNVELAKLQKTLSRSDSESSAYLRHQQETHTRRAMTYYSQVLMKEPNNIWAANGAGCVLACKGMLTEARDIFSQVLDANNDCKDALMNIAFTYMEQDMYFNAIKMFERCNKLSNVPDLQLLQHIAKAHYLNKDFAQAKNVLLKCRRIAPYNTKVSFQLAKVLRKIGWQPFHLRQSSGVTEDDSAYMEGLEQIKLAQDIFFSVQKSKRTTPETLKKASEIECGHCEVLIREMPSVQKKLEEIREEERKLKRKRDEEMSSFKESQLNEKILQERLEKEKEENRQKLREEVIKRTEKVKESLEFEQQQQLAEKKREKQQKKATRGKETAKAVY